MSAQQDNRLGNDSAATLAALERIADALEEIALVMLYGPEEAGEVIRVNKRHATARQEGDKADG